jgi:hypothetical protein
LFGQKGNAKNHFFKKKCYIYKTFSFILSASRGKEVQAIANATKNILYLFSEDKVYVFDFKSETFIKTAALPSTFVF